MRPTSNDRQISYLAIVFSYLKLTGEISSNSTLKLRLHRIPAGQYEPEFVLASDLLEEISSSSNHFHLKSMNAESCELKVLLYWSRAGEYEPESDLASELRER